MQYRIQYEVWNQNKKEKQGARQTNRKNIKTYVCLYKILHTQLPA